MKLSKIDALNEEKKEFESWIWTALLQLSFGIGFRHFLLSTVTRCSELVTVHSEKRRSFLFILGASWMFSLFWQVLIVAIAILTSWYGLWTWVWAGTNQIVPPMWILTLGDTSVISLGILSILSALLSFSLGVSGMGLIFCSLALFAGVLSIQGALLILFAERLGLWIHVLIRSQAHPVIHRDLGIRVTIAILLFINQFVFGNWVIDLVRLNLRFEYSHLGSRFFQFGCLYFVWAALETLISLIGFHFYWKILILKDGISK